MMAHFVRATVVEVKPLKSYVRLTVSSAPVAADARPGQFVMISPGPEVLLARPFSIALTDRDVIALVFQAVGHGTERLASLRTGDRVRLLGPLGNGFSLGTVARPVIVAGGRGIAPFYELTRRLASQSPILFYGGRSHEQIVDVEFFRQHCGEVIVTTEDGSMGRRGLLTEPLVEHLRREAPPVIYGCGPHAMLRAVAEVARDVRCEFSMEERMACGFGICMGCALPAGGSGYRRICVDGPVFDAREIRWKDLK